MMENVDCILFFFIGFIIGRAWMFYVAPMVRNLWHGKKVY
jgi:hypothetical protein